MFHHVNIYQSPVDVHLGGFLILCFCKQLSQSVRRALGGRSLCWHSISKKRQRWVCHEGPGFSLYVCALPKDDLCIECSIFSIFFFFQGQFKLSKYKNHIVKVHKLAIILFCMCVFVRNGWEVSSWSFHLLTEGTSLSRVLPFALFPGGRIPLDTLQHRGLCKAEKRQT